MNEYLFISDIGNTTISLAIFKDDSLVIRSELLTNGSELDDIKNVVLKMVHDSHFEDAHFSGGLISSVVPTLSRIVQIAVHSVINCLIPIMDERYNSLIKCDIDNPREIGADLLADIVGATLLYPAPLLVVDLGTITKFLLIDKTGTFVGTNFFPGLGLSTELMSEKTALLPKIKEGQKPKRYMGKNTIEAMESGLYYSTVHMIEGFVNNLNKEYENKLTVVLTGGYSNLIHESLPNYIYDKDLVLKGIIHLYRLGVKNGL